MIMKARNPIVAGSAFQQSINVFPTLLAFAINVTKDQDGASEMKSRRLMCLIEVNMIKVMIIARVVPNITSTIEEIADKMVSSNAKTPI